MLCAIFAVFESVECGQWVPQSYGDELIVSDNNFNLRLIDPNQI